MMKNRRRLLILVATSLSVGALVAAASGLGRASSAIEPVVLSSPSGEPPGNSFSMRIHYDPPPQEADPAIPADEAAKTAEAELGDADQVIEVQPVLASFKDVVSGRQERRSYRRPDRLDCARLGGSRRWPLP
jgi:hypothetical protein